MFLAENLPFPLSNVNVMFLFDKRQDINIFRVTLFALLNGIHFNFVSTLQHVLIYGVHSYFIIPMVSYTKTKTIWKSRRTQSFRKLFSYQKGCVVQGICEIFLGGSCWRLSFDKTGMRGRDTLRNIFSFF